VAPALQPMQLMQPMKIGLTLLLVGLSFPVLPHAMDRLTALITQALGAMAGA
jgi:flagellar biosynthetic protein FliR